MGAVVPRIVAVLMKRPLNIRGTDWRHVMILHGSLLSEQKWILVSDGSNGRSNCEPTDDIH